MEVSKPGLIGMTGLLIGILGVVGPIGWDYYKTKSELELRATEKTIIFDKQKKLNGLVITYAGEPLDELSKTTFLITNSGRTPVLKKDVASPLNVSFTKESKIIDAKIEGLQPADLGATIQFNKPLSQIIFDFPLLNPGDKISFSVLANAAGVDFSAGARIAGVSALKIVKDVMKGTNSKKTPWTVYPVGLFSILLGVASLMGFLQYPKERKIKRLFKSGNFELPVSMSKNQCINWVNSTFFFTTNNERAPLIATIQALSDADNFVLKHSEVLMFGIQNLLTKSASNLTMATIVFITASLGGWYVISNF